MSLTKGISIQNSVVFAIFSIVLIGMLMLAKCNSQANKTRKLISADSTFILESGRGVAIQPMAKTPQKED
ncbi:MAG: hypothetical protein ACJA0X_002692 [Cyclobacteriaceae bacterium]|jgi:hypothetical protein